MYNSPRPGIGSKTKPSVVPRCTRLRHHSHLMTSLQARLHNIIHGNTLCHTSFYRLPFYNGVRAKAAGQAGLLTGPLTGWSTIQAIQRRLLYTVTELERSRKHCTLLWPQFSTGLGISSRAMEFVLCAEGVILRILTDLPGLGHKPGVISSMTSSSSGMQWMTAALVKAYVNQPMSSLCGCLALLFKVRSVLSQLH